LLFKGAHELRLTRIKEPFIVCYTVIDFVNEILLFFLFVIKYPFRRLPTYLHQGITNHQNGSLLCLHTNLHQDITDQQFLMEDIARLPNIARMSLGICPQGHSFGASVFHLLRMSTGLKALWLALVGSTSHPEVILPLLCLSISYLSISYLVCIHISLHTEV
jgi:hypothetical protein